MTSKELANFWSHVDKTRGRGPNGDCWIWVGSIDKSKRGGYGLCRNDGRIQKAHRASWYIASGSIPENLQVLHHCDVRNCVNPDHLFLGTNQDNVDDKLSKGRHHRGELASSYANPVRGEENWNAKFSDEQILEMRRLYSDGVKIMEIADKYIAKRHVVSMIVHGDRWAHLPGAIPPHRSVLYEKEIMEMTRNGLSQAGIGKILGFSSASISRVVNNKNLGIIGKNWKTKI